MPLFAFCCSKFIESQLIITSQNTRLHIPTFQQVHNLSAGMFVIQSIANNIQLLLLNSPHYSVHMQLFFAKKRRNKSPYTSCDNTLVFGADFFPLFFLFLFFLSRDLNISICFYIGFLSYKTREKVFSRVKFFNSSCEIVFPL